MIMTTIDSLLLDYIKNPDDPKVNFDLAIYYDSIGQTASALSYYLRSAERSEDNEHKYQCLILSSECFKKQGTRNFTVKGLLQNAITVCPNRPEAYYHLSMFYESEKDRDGSWTDAYMMASIGASICKDRYFKKLNRELDYPGYYGLLFQKAINGWVCGICEESRSILKELLNGYEIDPITRRLCFNNLINIDKSVGFYSYTSEDYHKLKFKFDGSEKIERNYSEAFQDFFVLSLLNGKTNGSYLEIGSGSSTYGNNTYLLEKDFGWKGVGIDLCEEFVEQHKNDRKNPCYLLNALDINYSEFLKENNLKNQIDYLQIDCDPPSVTYEILLKIPFDEYKFSIITYEHDFYADETETFKEKSRKYLKSKGYELLISNVSPNDWKDYEDWWVHPDLVDKDLVYKFKNNSHTIKKSSKIFLNP